MLQFLEFCARQGRWVLVVGVLVGALLPDLAKLLRPHIGLFVALLLFVSCVRIGHRQALAALSIVRDHVAMALVLQLGFPLLLLAIFSFKGLEGVLVTATLIMGMGAPIAGSPNLAIMMGADGGTGLRQLIIGTLLLPLTCLPILFFIPGIGDIWGVSEAAIRLIIVIFGAAILGFVVRAKAFGELGEFGLARIDGISAILMGVVVVGLMTAVGQTLYSHPERVAGMLLFALAVNFGSQVVFAEILSRVGRNDLSICVGIAAGNRNIAIFLAALPASAIDPILLFIGCYQIPMYITPLVMKRYYQRFT